MPRWLALSVTATLLFALPSSARNPIRNAFFETYPVAEDTQLDGLPSDTNHCGVCHFDFAGSGPRNPYGLGIEVGLGGGLSAAQAILAIQGNDSDGDGFSNLVEITEIAGFSNTPTFPGLSAGNVGAILNIPPSEVTPYLTPSGSSDMTPPSVVVLDPSGGENVFAVGFYNVSYTATDAGGVSHVNVWLSDDGGATYKLVGENESPTGAFAWFVPNFPGMQNRIRVQAVDIAGNSGSDESDLDFTITSLQAGIVATTLRDMELPGTQPHEGAILADANDCAVCHGGYDAVNEPWNTWQGSLMGQAMRDPLFLACLTVAEQDAPSVGDLCIRCHSPGGWQEGRSVDTSGGLLNAKDFQGVQCDMCHRSVDPDYTLGIDPMEDEAILAQIDPLPLHPGNGQFIQDPGNAKRGPYGDAEASHQFLESAFLRSGDQCGTCHDVSSPAWMRTGTFDYALDPLDQAHPTFDTYDMFPIERTYSEWKNSEYAVTGVFAPQFAGNKPGGIVSSCQDCHMRDVTAAGCNEPGAPTRDDLPLHDFTGGNTFIPDILDDLYPGEVDPAALSYAKDRATDMLQLAATLEGTPQPFGLMVRVTNETGHKMPSGYPEGRRIWLHVRAVDESGTQVFESGHYDAATGDLTHDESIKIYEIHPGLSPAVAGLIGLPAGPSFHFVLNDTIYADNRIPPRGFTNAAFEDIQSAPVDYAYFDGQYWDDTGYFLPADAESAYVTLYYQTTTREYVEFLRDANTTNDAGQVLYDAWVANGRAAPVVMQQIAVDLDDIVTVIGGHPELPRGMTLSSPRPNPAREITTVVLGLPHTGRVRAAVYDTAGRRVRTVVDGVLEAGRHELTWDFSSERGDRSAPGVYFLRVQTEQGSDVRRIVRLR